MKNRILIVDDHAMVRMGLVQAIQQQNDMSVAGEAANGRQAIELYRDLQPDVVIMDYKLPGRDGVTITSLICEEFPSACILLLSIFEGQENIWRAMQAGATGYCSKSVEIEEVIAAIRQISTGRSYFSPGLEERLKQRRPEDSLSPREHDVLQQIAKGESNKEITQSLGMSASTVKHHIERIFDKLSVQDRTQAIIAAAQRGILQIE